MRQLQQYGNRYGELIASKFSKCLVWNGGEIEGTCTGKVQEKFVDFPMKFFASNEFFYLHRVTGFS